MSVRVMTWVWDQPISPNHKIVLLAIADHAHDDGSNAWPSADRVAAMTGYSTRSVRRLIHEMVQAGYLGIEKPGGGRFTSRYCLPVGTELTPPQPDSDPGQNDTPAVTPMSPHPGHPRPGTPDTGDRGTIREPDPEPPENPSAEAADEEAERIRDLVVTPDAVLSPGDNPLSSDRKPVPADRDDSNPLWNALEDVFGYRPTGAEARHWGKLVKSLRDKGATADEIPERAKRLVGQWGAKALTPASLDKHWDRFGSPIGSATEADEDRLRQDLDRATRRARLGVVPDEPQLEEPPGRPELGQSADHDPEPDAETDAYHRAMQETRSQREAIFETIDEIDHGRAPAEREDPE